MEKTTYDDERRIAYLSSGQTIFAVHKSTQCYGEVCPLHAPSDHPLRDAPLSYDAMRGSFFRIVDGKEVIDPDDYNLNTNGKVILKNAVRCLYCNTSVESEFRHDFKYCSCGKTAVDGGSAYLRRVGDGNWVDESIVFYKEGN